MSKKETLTRLLKNAYPHIRAGCDLPPWLLPEASLNRVADELGDTGILSVSRPLGLAKGVAGLLESRAAPPVVTPQAWQEAVKQRLDLGQLRPVVQAFLEVADTVTAQFPWIRERIDPMVICRSLAVLLFAPFVDQGKGLLEELARVLGSEASQSADLVRRYGEAVAERDIPTLEKVNACIVKYLAWQEWASALQAQVYRCRCRPKLIAVTPPLSTDLIRILATILKEEKSYDESGCGPAGNTSGQVFAR